MCGLGDDSVKALLLGVGICPGPQPGAGDGEILLAGQHQRSPVTVVTVVTTHTDKWSCRGPETNCRNFSHILHSNSQDTVEMSVGSWVDQAFLEANQEISSFTLCFAHLLTSFHAAREEDFRWPAHWIAEHKSLEGREAADRGSRGNLPSPRSSFYQNEFEAQFCSYSPVWWWLLGENCLKGVLSTKFLPSL